MFKGLEQPDYENIAKLSTGKYMKVMITLRRHK